MTNMADLAITSLHAPAQVRANSPLIYTLVLTNFGPDSADSVTVSDTLPTGLSFVSCQSTGGGVCGDTGNNRTVSFASLAAGASAVITLTTSVNCSGADGTLINNTASVSATSSEPNSGNNSAMATTTITNPIWLYPASQSFAANGGAGNVQVSLPSGCAAAVSSNDPWLTITGNSGGLVTYSVAAHSGSSPRSGTINIAGRLFTVLQGAVFSDVPESHAFYTFIGKLSARAVTQGCGSGSYCPENSVTREQMAAFIIRALHEPGYVPSPPAQQRFNDVPPSHPFYAHIEEMALRQITLGCASNPPLYCPTQQVTREQMAAFIIRALHEPGYVPPPPTQQRFNDVPSTNPFYAHIEEMAVRQITLGCSATPPLYCPAQNVTRGQMAAFLIRAFDNPNLPPSVNAGSDQNLLLPTNSLTLNGAVADDGMPTGGALTVMWSKLSGPGTVSFNNANAAVTQASFSAAGAYVLRLTASDSVLTTSDDVTVVVSAPLTVNAGTDQVVTLPNTAFLAGMTSGGTGTIRLEWRQQSGPDTVLFSDASVATTTAIFRTAGVYVLRLTALDAQSAVSDEVQVTVNADPTPPPADPSLVAPPLDLTVATTMSAATQFLYTGANPIQTGVVAGTINPTRVAVLRGRVLDKNNTPLALVKVTVLNHPEFGQTLSRADGRFDLAVNGGGVLNLKYEKVGYITAQRQETVPWQDYESVPDLVLIGYDPNVTLIDLQANTPVQVASGSVQTDTSGTRRARLFFKQGTTATLKLPGGAMQGLNKLHVRATEFTVGTNGPQTMPGDLPATSGYTYSAEYSVDEAVAVNATEVSFSQAVVQYNENFLNFPVGTVIPSGAYDLQQGIWVGSTSGRVVKILSISGGTANLDLNGSGQPATDPEYAALGINTAERQKLAELYAINQTLWRVPLIHFTPWTEDRPFDSNWPIGPPVMADDPDVDPPDDDESPTCPNKFKGCIIGAEGQTLSEEVALTGAPYFLRYDSERQAGRVANYRARIQLSRASIPPPLKRIELTVRIAGQTHAFSFPAQTNQTTTFTWNGLDAYGRRLQGRYTATIDIGYVYDGVYQNTANFGYNGNGIPITGSLTRQEITLHQFHSLKLGIFDTKGLGLGGWMLSEHHVYDPVGKILYQGDGQRRSITDGGVSSTLETINLPGSGFSGDGGHVSNARFNFPGGVGVGPDGSVYVADSGNARVRKIAPNGIVTTFAGNGGGCTPAIFPCGSGGSATQASLGANIRRVAVAREGSVIISGDRNVWRVAPNGIINIIAGTAFAGFSGDGGLAVNAQLSASTRAYPAPDGSVYITDQANNRIRRITPDGIINTVAGNGTQGFSGDGGPATSAQINTPGDVVVALDGSFYFIDIGNNRIRRVGTDGIITNYAGTGVAGDAGDGVPASQATFTFSCFCNPQGQGSLQIGLDGSLYLVSFPTFTAGRVRRIGPDHIVTAYAGNGTNGNTGDGGPALGAPLRTIATGLALDGSLYLVGGFDLDEAESRIRRIASTLPGFTASDAAIPSEDGTQLFKFNANGKHLETRNTFTGALVYSFTYDAAGRLTQITDGDNNVTTIQRNGAGNPTGIVSPYNQTTSLQLDANGYLNRITDPLAQFNQFTYTAQGLMTNKTDPRGNSTIFSYNAQGQLTRDDDAATGFQTFTRTDVNQLTYHVMRNTALNRQSTFQVEEQTNGNQLRLNTLPSGLQIQTTLNQNGTTTTTDPDGTIYSTTEGGDPRFKIQAPITKSASITTPSTLAFNFASTRAVTLSNLADPLSLQTQTDTFTVNGQNYTSIFNATNKTFTNTTPLNRQSVTTIDTQGRITNFLFANLDPLAFTYDTRGRLSTATQGTGGQARTYNLAYNTAGFLASFTDPLNQTTAFSYDAAGRVTQQTLADTRIIAFGYDANGNLTSLTPPGRPAHTFAYNAVNLLTSYTPPAVPGTGPTQFVYNLDRQPTTITRPDALTINYAYDTAGRLSTLTTPSGTYTHSYSGTTGNLTGLTAPGSQTLAFAYDGALLTSTTWSGTVAGSASRTFNNFFLPASQSVNGGNTINFTYDNDNLLAGAGSLAITRHAQNGLVTGTTLSSVTDTRGYSGFGELTSYSASFNASNLYSASFTRDKLGRITQKVESVQGGAANTYDYSYDATGRLTQVKLNTVTISTYVYDSNDNRTSLTTSGGTVNGTYDAQDRLTAYGTATYNYMANGELSSKTVGAQTTSYGYDVLGNLRTVILPGGTQIEYVIDGLNRRVGKKVGGVLMQGWLYQNQLKPVAELDGSNNMVSRFVYGTSGNVPDYVIKGGATYRLITDHLGSVRLIVDVATGNIAQRIDYDEFGVVLLDTNPGFQPFGFAGGLYDSQTKLVRFGARDYDAETGRWTAKDPILFAGGDTNLYAYAFNNPINFADIDGLAPAIQPFNPNDLFNPELPSTPQAKPPSLSSPPRNNKPPLPPNKGGKTPRKGKKNPGEYCDLEQSKRNEKLWRDWLKQLEREELDGLKEMIGWELLLSRLGADEPIRISPFNRVF
jgi:RHS repeat-associated protein/uncharacterized repeat protein (TIGR01451 family)